MKFFAPTDALPYYLSVEYLGSWIGAVVLNLRRYLWRKAADRAARRRAAPRPPGRPPLASGMARPATPDFVSKNNLNLKLSI